MGHRNGVIETKSKDIYNISIMQQVKR